MNELAHDYVVKNLKDFYETQVNQQNFISTHEQHET